MIRRNISGREEIKIFDMSTQFRRLFPIDETQRRGKTFLKYNRKKLFNHLQAWREHYESQMILDSEFQHQAAIADAVYSGL